MASQILPSTQDIWKEWLLERRFAGDEAVMQKVLDDFLYPVRDKILNRANIQENEVLLDVGCGDGLVAFGAVERLNSGQVIFCDISQDLLDHVEILAQQMEISDCCHFLNASAETLSAVADASVNVVTTRSVLIYVADKRQAFNEFFRVLKPGGRISLFEPINRFGYPPPQHIFLGCDVTPIMEITDKLKSVFIKLQPLETDPMLNFDERDLVEMAETAGFDEICLDLKIEIKPFPDFRTWENLMNTAGNPKIPTLAEAMDQVLSEAEKREFVSYLRPLVEVGEGKVRSSLAYLWAVKW
ncbi:MAG: class I SAM-dependent methyltransferase [Chloroflexi bacterium]|nr:class I SAM-dependent methyltransferase [Chloroflexota bacterium]